MSNAMIENETDRRYRLEEQKAIASLPSEMAKIWRKKRLETFLHPDHAKKVRYQRRPRAVGLWKPATACFYLNQTLRLIAIIRERTPEVPITVPSIYSETVINDVLTSNVFRSGSTTRALFCRANYMVAWRIFDVQAPRIEDAFKNMRRDAERIDHSDRVLPRQVYEQIASDLAFRLPDDCSHDLKSATSHRDAAIIACCLELALRGSEMVNLRVKDIVPNRDRKGLSVFVPSSTRKARPFITGQIDGEAARIVSQYLQDARPVLLNGNPDSEALWLKRKGQSLSRESLRQMLRIKLGNLCGAPCSSNIMRSLKASRTDIREEHLGRRVGHSGKSPLAYDLYPIRDMSIAHEYNQIFLKHGNFPSDY